MRRNSIVIPEPESVVNRPGLDARSRPPRIEAHPVNPIASSAAAKVEMHLRVPDHKRRGSLIAKPLAPLEVAAKETDKKIRVKTIKHTDCIEVGHDKFDEVVSNFLVKDRRGQRHQHQHAQLHPPGHRHPEAADRLRRDGCLSGLTRLLRAAGQAVDG